MTDETVEFQTVCGIDVIPDGEGRAFPVNGMLVAVFRQDQVDAGARVVSIEKKLRINNRDAARFVFRVVMFERIDINKSGG